MLEVTYYVFTLLFQLILYLVLFISAVSIGVRLWFEPHKATCKCKVRLDNKVALVTGGNTGIGLETARDLARRGARVIITGRNEEKSKRAVEDIIATTGNVDVEYKQLDLSNFRKVREFAEDFNKTVDRLDILVNNAGCWGLHGQYTYDGLDMVMQVNFLSPLLLTNLLLDKLEKSKPSRIVVVTSGIHYIARLDPTDVGGLKNKYSMITNVNSKLCIVLWTRALSKRLPRGVTVNCLNPGIANTEVFRNLSKIIQIIVIAGVKIGHKTPVEGAQTSIHVCVSPDLEGVSGEYFKDCKLANMSTAGKDDDLAETVWNNSVKLIEDRLTI